MILPSIKNIIQPNSVISRVFQIVVFMVVLVLGQAQTQLSIYKNLTTAYGLPSNYITKIQFDTDGFLWMISPKGLTKYDGNNYKLVIDSRGKNKLSGEEILDFCIIKNHIWYITKEGKLFSFNMRNCFIKAYPLGEPFSEKPRLSSIYADLDQKIWLSVFEYGILIIDTKTNKKNHIYHQDKNSNSLISNNITDIYQAERNAFLLASDKGFSIYYPLESTFQNFSNTKEIPNLLLSNNIQSITKDYSGNIWLGSNGSGLSKFNTSSLERYDFVFEENKPTSLSNNYIHDLFIDNKNMLWVSTFSGLNTIDINNNTLVLKFLKNNSVGLSSNDINNIIQSDMGNIWVALNGGGISIIENSEPKFINKKFSVIKKQYAGTPITDIETDNSDRIWFLSPNDGVMIYTNQGKYLPELSIAINNEIIANKQKINSIFIDNSDLFLMGDEGSLFYLDIDAKEVKFSTFDLQMKVKKLKCVFYDQETNLWILNEKGAFCYKDNRVIDSVNTSSISNCMTQDYRGNLWIGTVGDGLWVYNLSTKKRINYHSTIGASGLVGDNISYFYEDNTGVMWVGTTDGGLCKFNRNTEKFTPFVCENRTMSSEVFSIIEDDMDNLWVASEYGLIKINEINSKFSLFGLGQGLTRNQYNPKAVLKDKNGYLFFGTENGLLSFDPTHLSLKKEFPELRFTDFFVFNESIFSIDDTVTKNDFTINSAVYLQAKNNYIGIEYAALNLDHSQKIQYKYRLLGAEDEWIFCRNNNFVSYLNIPSGSYVFQLMSTNVDGVWNKKIKELKIEITPPFYLTTGFKITLFVLILIVVLGFVYYRFKFQRNITYQLERKVDEKTRQLKESNLRLKEEVEERRLAEESADSANKTKGLFLANMSHEIRTPMNSIIGFADLLSSLVQDKKQRKYLDSIIRSGRSLLFLINDILDLSKIDSGSFNIEYQPVNIVELLNEIHQIFMLKCDEKDLELNISIDPQIPELLILSDARLRQVLINIIGNAIKFTDNGSISISVLQLESDDNALKRDLKIDVVDTGIGIPENQQNKIFNVFQQQEGQAFSKYGGTGLGLNISKKLMELMGGDIQVVSKENEGSTFSISLYDVPVFTEVIKEKKDRVSLLQMDLSDYSLLIVDDSPANRYLIIEYLTPSGAMLIEAGNGQQAYEKAQELLPSIIFLDIRMPVMNGFETAKALKNYPPTRHIPLVAFTANVSFESDVKYHEAGFEHVLLKPIDFEKLGDIIQELLNIDNVTEEQQLTDAVVENIGFENIQIVDLKKAQEELSSLMEEWDYVKGNKFVNVILDFSAKIVEIGERYSVNSIIAFGKQLQANAYSFDTVKIEHDLSLFPALIDELKTYLND